MSEKKIVIKLKYGASASQDHESPSPVQPQYDWNYKRIASVVGVAVIALLGYRLLIGSPELEVAKGAAEIDVQSESLILEKQPTFTGSSPSAPKFTPIQADGYSSLNKPQHLTDAEMTVSVIDKTRQGEQPVTKQGLPVQGNSELDVADTAAFQGAATIDVPAPIHTKNIARARFTWGIKDKEPTGEIISPAILQPGDSVALYFFSEFKDMTGKTLSHEWSHNGRVVASKNFHISENRWRVFSSKQLTSNLLGEWKVSIKDSKGENLEEFVLKVLQPNKSEI